MTQLAPRGRRVLTIAEIEKASPAQQLLFISKDEPPSVSRRDPDQGIRALQEYLVRLPSEAELRTYLAAASATLASRTENRIRRAVVDMVACFPNARPPDAAAYLNTMAADLLDLEFPDAIVEHVCKTLRRSSRFAPAIAEVVAEATDLWEVFGQLATIIERIEGNRTEAQDRLIEAQAPGFKIEPQPQRLAAPEPPKTPFTPFPNLVAAFEGDKEAMDALGRRAFDRQMMLSAVLQAKGHAMCRTLLMREDDSADSKAARAKRVDPLPIAACVPPELLKPDVEGEA